MQKCIVFDLIFWDIILKALNLRSIIIIGFECKKDFRVRGIFQILIYKVNLSKTQGHPRSYSLYTFLWGKN